MSRQLKCPHCATIIEDGVLVCYGCFAELEYVSAEANECRAATPYGCGGFIIALVLVAAIVGGIWGDVKKAPDWAMCTGWGMIFLIAFVSMMVGYHNVSGTGNRSVKFRRRYPDNRVVEVEVELRNR
jgi:hypothetical protein